MQGGPLEARSSIPLHLPLAALAPRLVVPRDTPALGWSAAPPAYPPRTSLDHRVTVPAATPPGEFQPHGPFSIQDLPAVLPPDVITTGEVNLLIEPVEHPRIEWSWIARGGSLAAHLALLLLIVFQAKVFPYQPPLQAQADISREQLNMLYLPPDVRMSAPEKPPAPPAPPQQKIRIDPRFLRQLDSIDERAVNPVLGPRTSEPPQQAGQPEPAPAPAPAPAPVPKPEPQPRQPELLQPHDAALAAPGRALVLPRASSPGRALEESAQQALRGSAGRQTFGGELPGAPGAGGGQGYLGGNVEMLTPTEGVDFTSYLARIVASVKRNWYSAMPESARLGDQGRVVLQFRIYRNGMVPEDEPGLMGSSGKEPLDRAAIASIRSSSPFPPLPAAFSGPYIELRFLFLYNLPLSYQ